MKKGGREERVCGDDRRHEWGRCPEDDGGGREFVRQHLAIVEEESEKSDEKEVESHCVGQRQLYREEEGGFEMRMIAGTGIEAGELVDHSS